MFSSDLSDRFLAVFAFEENVEEDGVEGFRGNADRKGDESGKPQTNGESQPRTVHAHPMTREHLRGGEGKGSE